MGDKGFAAGSDSLSLNLRNRVQVPGSVSVAGPFSPVTFLLSSDFTEVIYSVAPEHTLSPHASAVAVANVHLQAQSDTLQPHLQTRWECTCHTSPGVKSS